MDSRYTSYATSLALREAGAPQGELQSPEGETFWRAYASTYHEDPGKRLRCFEVRRPHATYSPGSVDGEPTDVDGMARAYRLDELLELLAAPRGVHQVSVSGAPERWEAWGCGLRNTAHAATPVEAAAACLLAVRRAREVSE